MAHLLINRLLDRAEREKSESDFAYFHSLLGTGEALLKVTTLGLLAAIEDDTERNRYRLLYQLVRTSSLGDWYEVMSDATSGPASNYMIPAARPIRTELTKNHSTGAWQSDAVHSLRSCLDLLDLEYDAVGQQVSLLAWFRLFVTLRNNTRGHGAISSSQAVRLCEPLSESIQQICQHLDIFNRSWVYLYRNLSGKYRVNPITHTSQIFEPLKSDPHYSFDEGVYIDYGTPALVPLMVSDPDLDEFFLPNGNFRDTSFQLLSYITGNRDNADSTPYLLPPADLPSETHGFPGLLPKGNCFTNAPEPSEDYVNRDELEAQLFELLQNHHNRVVTLQGAGGVGKTSLALKVIERLTDTERYELIVWFSARDIDLSPYGPKTVRPGFLTKTDVATQYAHYVLSTDTIPSRPTDREAYFQKQLAQSDGGNCLFVFDNFETVRDRLDMYNWIEQSVRPPNKVLITTRLRDFKGDYHTEVRGMREPQARALINQTSLRLGIFPRLTPNQIEDLINESEGHPYVIKIVLGDIAAKKAFRSPKSIVASSNDILTALFERTFDALTPCAQRAFLTLSPWNSAVPRAALEAVLMRSTGERSEVEKGIDSLVDYSLAEHRITQEDRQEFIGLTLAAHLFGNSLLQINQHKPDILQDVAILQMFSPTSISGGKLDMDRLLRSFITNISERIDQGGNISEYSHILEMVCQSYNQGRLQLAQWHLERGSESDISSAIDHIETFIRNNQDQSSLAKAWRMLAKAYWSTGNVMAELNAWVERSRLEDVSFYDISRTANYVNNKFREWNIGQGIDVLANQLLEIMISRRSEADADDFSRMAWLALNTRQESKAIEFVNRGLDKDPDNQHCRRIADRLERSV